MTSDDTHDATAALLRDNAYFGAKPAQITLMKQKKVACLVDNAAHLAMGAEDPYDVLEKPHGHGDVHTLLHQHGLAQAWVQAGFRWLALFQDTNSLVFRGLLATLGAPAATAVSASQRADALALPRACRR